ncbi:hypothetical protein BK129_24675 [Paenibacillus amylolyticus]|nr:hypothetical protein BK129_24675 [Paenibacillus amylolyticus]OMF41203.1 hypothetical protein BK136_21765 [Paenibacillus amylolyticus]
MRSIAILEIFNELAVVLLLIGTFFYFLELRKIKRQRKLTVIEYIMYVTIQVGYLLWAGSRLIMLIS